MQEKTDRWEGFHGHPGFYGLLERMAELHSRKNHDYAGIGTPLRNFYKCKTMGVSPFTGVMVRLSDKWSRLESFMRQGVLEVSSESVEDTLLDNAVYSLLAILLLKEEQDERIDNKPGISAADGGNTEGLPSVKDYAGKEGHGSQQGYGAGQKAPVVPSTSVRLSTEHPWARTQTGGEGS